MINPIRIAVDGLVFAVSVGIFISSSRAAHKNCDEFIAFGNDIWEPGTCGDAGWSEARTGAEDAGHLRRLGAWSADLHWGAHAPPRVVFGALAEDFFPSSLSPLTQNIFGGGAGNSTQGRVRSPPLARRHRSQPSTLQNYQEQALPVEGIRLAGIATIFATRFSQTNRAS